jgi:FixJ family two-component response regulator
VLLVDRDASLRRALARAMRLAGFEVEPFATIEALLAFGAIERAACLVLEVDMPGVGGIEFKQALMASGRDRPTVFMTASGRDGLDAQLARLGPVAVLHKPFNKEDLLDALARAFE